MQFVRFGHGRVVYDTKEMNDDAELLRRYVDEQSGAAFTALVERHIGFVYATALRQLDGAAHRADDVTQSVFIDLARKARTLMQRRELVGWLYTSTRFAAAKLKRAEQRRQKYEEQAQALAEIDAAADLAWSRLRPVLDDALEQLSVSDRDAILMRYFQGRRFAEIAARLGLSEDAARMRVDRALDKLRGLLARRNIASTAAALGAALASQPAVAVPAGLAASVTTAALGGAGVVGAGLFGIMSGKTLVASTVAILALGVAGYEYRTSRRESVRAAAMLKERNALEKKLVALQQKADAATEVHAARLKEAPAFPQAKLAVAPAAFRTTPSLAEEPSAAVGRGWTFKLGSQDPAELRRQMRENNRRNLEISHAALFQQLGLTAPQREQFKDLVLEVKDARANLFKDAVAAARARNPHLDRADMYEIAQATNDQIAKEQVEAVRQAFGENVSQAFERFQAIAPTRSIASQLATALFNTDSPLTPTQANQLVDALAAHAVGPLGKVDVLALNVDAALADIQARGILSAAQLEQLRPVIAQTQETAKAERNWNTAPATSVKVSGGIAEEKL